MLKFATFSDSTNDSSVVSKNSTTTTFASDGSDDHLIAPNHERPASCNDRSAAIVDTAHNTGMVLTVAFDYGSRFEMMNAARSARADGSDLNMSDITKRLHDADLPPVDVMIRTSGEIRLKLSAVAGGRGSDSLHRYRVARSEPI